MLTPVNLQRFPFVILICKEIHTHPLPLLSKTPTYIKSELKKLIENTKDQLIDITAQQLISGQFNSFLLYFFKLLKIL